jgi:hypothetical protein
MLKMERKFPYLRIRVTDGEVGKLPIRKKNPGELLGPLAGASITVTREDRYEAPYEGVISAAIRTVHGGRPPRPEPVRGPVVARITFGGGQSREWQISGYARVEAAVEAAEFNELAALEPTGTGPAVPGVPYPRRRGRLGGLIAGVLSVPCELCGVPPGCGCDSVSPVFAEMVRLAKSPPLVVHTGRMASAITAGAVSRHAVVAQFQGNPLPAAVAAAVAAARPRPTSRLGAAACPGTAGVLHRSHAIPSRPARTRLVT